MLFEFLKYKSPVWYYNLIPEVERTSYWANYHSLSHVHQQLIEFDEGYSCRDTSLRDAAWQAWQRGIVVTDSSSRLILGDIAPSLADNYRFIRKYYHVGWSWYILFIRLLSFHHPFREIAAFVKTAETKRFPLFEKAEVHAHWEKYASNYLSQRPLVGVVIPTLNRYGYLKDVLRDLEQQDYSNFEVLVVDQSEPYQPHFYDGWNLKLSVISQEEKALWQARNTAIQSTNAQLLLLYDDDSRVEKDWISNHLKCLDYFNCDISAGISLSAIGAKVPPNYSYFRWSDQLDTGNVLIKREVFKQVGLFDRQFERQRMGDAEFGLRAYLAGYRSVSNPFASRIHLKVEQGGLRQMGSWDGFRPKNWFSPRPIPSVLYYSRKYFGNNHAFFFVLNHIAPSLIPYKFKGKKWIMPLGIGIFLISSPLIVWQVARSWYLSGRMLKEGALISRLKE